MRQMSDVGNASLYSGAVMGTTTTAASITDVITSNATLIGLGLTAVSIIAGLIFKAISTYYDIKHQRNLEKQDAEYKKWLMSKKE